MRIPLQSNSILKIIFHLLPLFMIQAVVAQDRCYDTIQTTRFSLGRDSSITITNATPQRSGNSLLVGRIWTTANASIEFPVIIKRDKFDKLCWAKKLLLPSLDSTLKITAALELSNGEIVAHAVRTLPGNGNNFRHVMLKLDAQGNLLSSQYFLLGNFIEGQQLLPYRTLLKELNDGSVIFLLGIRGKTILDLIFIARFNSSNQLRWNRNFYSVNDNYSPVNWVVDNDNIVLAGNFATDQNACDPIERVGIHLLTMNATTGAMLAEKSYCQQLFPGSPPSGNRIFTYSLGEFIRLSDASYSLLTYYNGQREGGRFIACRFDAQLGLLPSKLIRDPNPASHWVLSRSSTHPNGNFGVTYVTLNSSKWGYMTLSKEFVIGTTRQFTERQGFQSNDLMLAHPVLSMDSFFSVIHSTSSSGKSGFENFNQRLSRIDSLSDCNGKDTVIAVSEALNLDPGNWRLIEGPLNTSQQNNFTIGVENIDLLPELVCRKILAPPPLSTGPDKLKCATDSLVLTATTGYQNYQWMSPYNMIGNNTPQVVVFPAIDTSYTVSAEVLTGCIRLDTVQINVVHTPVIHLGADTSFCESSSLSLDAGNGFDHFNWNTGQITQAIHVSSVGTYSVIATDANGCLSRDTLQVISLFLSPQVNIRNQPTICRGQQDTLKTFNSTDLHLWQDGSTRNFYHVTAPGTYWVSLTSAEGCIASDTVRVVTLHSSPQNFLHPEEKFCEGAELKLTPARRFETYAWSTGATTQTITVKEPGIYSLAVKDQFGCIATASTVITEEDCVNRILFPSAFTPDNNGRNDSFKPSVSGVLLKYSLTVYNRWGQVVFRTNDFTKGWDGTLQGLMQETGNFVWFCNYQFYKKTATMQKGSVVLIQK